MYVICLMDGIIISKLNESGSPSQEEFKYFVL